MTKLTDDELLDELRNRFLLRKKSVEESERMTAELKLLNQRLEDSEKLKSHFLSNIRNEIINPFASIIGLSQNIMMLGPDKIQRIKSSATMIHSEAFTLDFQLQNIFAAAEIEAGESSPQPMTVDVNSIFKSVISSFNHEIVKKKITVTYNSSSEELLFKTDPEKLGVIFSNLLSNSIKYSHEEGTIKVEVAQSESVLHFSVKDTGIGMDNDAAKTIFDRFKRVDNTINTLNSGHGLGLSVVQSLLDLLDGQIELDASKDVGATFIVKINEGNVPEGMHGFATDENEFLFDSDGDVF